jgi:hypothetical protein
MASKRELAAIERANNKKLAKRVSHESEQRYMLADQTALDAADDSPNLQSEFVLVRQIIQRMIDQGLAPQARLPFIALETKLAQSMLAMGLQLSILVPAGSLRDAAKLIAGAVDESLAIHAPGERAAAAKWINERLVTLLLDDADDQPIALPAAKQIYRFNQAPASSNLSLGGSLKLLRFDIQGAIDAGNWDFVLLLIGQLLKSAQVQLSLAKVEGLLVSQSVSRRMTLEMTTLASKCITQFAPDSFDLVIDEVRSRVMGPTKQQYRIENR